MIRLILILLVVFPFPLLASDDSSLYITYGQGKSFFNFVLEDTRYNQYKQTAISLGFDIHEDNQFEPPAASFKLGYQKNRHFFELHYIDFDRITTNIVLLHDSVRTLNGQLIGKADVSSFGISYQYQFPFVWKISDDYDFNMRVSGGLYRTRASYYTISDVRLLDYSEVSYNEDSISTILPSLGVTGNLIRSETYQINIFYQRIGDFRMDKFRSHVNHAGIEFSFHF